MKRPTCVYVSESLKTLAKLQGINLSQTLEQALIDRLGGTRDELESRAMHAIEEAEALKEMALLSSADSERIQGMGIDFLKHRASLPVGDKAHLEWIENLKGKYGFGKRAKPEDLLEGIKAFLATSPDAAEWRRQKKEKERKMADLQKRLERIQAERKEARNNGSG